MSSLVATGYALAMRTFTLLPLLFALACVGGKDEGSTDESAAGDADTDTDTDTDSDADTDSDVCDAPNDICDGDACVWNGAGAGWTVSGALRFDGAALADAPGAGDWTLVMTDEAAGLAYATSGDGPDFSLRVPTGTYDVTFVAGAQTDFPGTWPMATGVAITADATKNFAAEAWTVSGALRLDGATLTDAAGSDDWTLTFTDDATGLAYAVAGDGASYAVDVPTGTYDVTLTTSDRVGVAGTWPLASGVAISADATKNFDVALYTVGGSLRFDGGTIAARDAWTLTFVDPSTGLAYGDAGTGDAYAVVVPAGTYDVTLSGGDGSDFAGAWRMASDVAISADATKNFDVAAYTVSGTLRFDGAAIAPDQGWTLLFVDAATGDTYADAGDGPDFELSVPEGTYTVRLVGASGGDFPGTWPMADGVAIDADTTKNFDVAAYAVSGTLRFDGEALTGADGWALTLSDPATGLAYGDAGTGANFEVLVPAGDYDVLLTGGGGSDFSGDWPMAAGMTVSEDLTKNFDVAAWEVTGALRFDGAVIPDVSGSPDWTLVWTEITTGLSYAESGDGADFAVDLPAGVYDVTLQGSAETDYPGAWPMAECVEVGG